MRWACESSEFIPAILRTCGFGQLWLATCGFGQLWLMAYDLGHLWLAASGFGHLRPMARGFGQLWLVARGFGHLGLMAYVFGQLWLSFFFFFFKAVARKSARGMHYALLPDASTAYRAWQALTATPRKCPTPTD